LIAIPDEAVNVAVNIIDIVRSLILAGRSLRCSGAIRTVNLRTVKALVERAKRKGTGCAKLRRRIAASVRKEESAPKLTFTHAG